MAEINPMGRMYNDMLRILDSMVIKYSYRADANETLEVRSSSERYMLACNNQDTFYTYDDYTKEEFLDVDNNLTDEDIISYMNDLRSVPISIQAKLLKTHRENLKKNYIELNDYYRMLNGLPNLGEEDFIFYLPDELSEKYGIPKGIPIHEIGDKVGSFYIRTLEQSGYIDQLIKENEGNPDVEYLQHLGVKRIPIAKARRAKNFSILYLSENGIADTTYREFIHIYEQCRSYFMNTIYIFEYRSVITDYDKFIALCIFVMTIQQLSVKVLKNAADREFYDVRAIQILYETYGIPFNEKIDEIVQKQLAQNINILVQNKACDKVLLDICSILGFSGIEIYEYYLMKRRLFGDDERPIFKKVKKINKRTGKEEEVYDYKSMYELYFQRVPITETDIHAALTDRLNRVDYYDVVYYDPFWWEDSELEKEIWEIKYNVIETKYLGMAIPYRLTEMVFQSVYLLRIIEDNDIKLSDVEVYLPRVSDKSLTLVETIMFMSAIMAKKNHISGKVYVMPSKLLHILEVIDQDVNNEESYKEVLGFNFDAFSHENIKKTREALDKYLTERKYHISEGHDVDIREDGTQDTYAPTHLVNFDIDTHKLDKFEKYLLTLSNESFGFTDQQKVEALNNLFSDVQSLYHFLSYWMSVTQDLDEIYTIRKFYETAFYTKEIPRMFEVDIEKNKEFTYEDWLLEHRPDLYEFLQDVPEDSLYEYMNHVIYCLSKLLKNIGDLYILNDGVSPLQELIMQLIDFFRSFTTDMIDFTSIMLIDWRMENMLKLVDHPQYMHKVIGTWDDFSTMAYADFIHKFMARLTVDDFFKMYGSSSICATEDVDDEFHFEDAVNRIAARLVVPDSGGLILEDIPSLKTTIRPEPDRLVFQDDYRIIRTEAENS